MYLLKFLLFVSYSIQIKLFSNSSQATNTESNTQKFVHSDLDLFPISMCTSKVCRQYRHIVRGK